MNREKQIEEMAKDICHLGRKCPDCSRQAMCKAVNYASRFYDKGYRKASDVAGEIFEEIEKLLKRNELRNYEPYNVESYYSGDLEKDLAKLKKKYTEDEK